MSYSFSVLADTKAEATRLVAEKFDEQVTSCQPQHNVEKAAVLKAAQELIGVLTDTTEGESVSVSMHGSLSWRGEGVYYQASVGISAAIIPAQ